MNVKGEVQRVDTVSSTVNLYEAKKNCVFQLASIPDIALLENIGLRVGTQVAVQNRYALGGPVLLRVDGAYSVAVGKDIATQITVREFAES